MRIDYLGLEPSSESPVGVQIRPLGPRRLALVLLVGSLLSIGQVGAQDAAQVAVQDVEASSLAPSLPPDAQIRNGKVCQYEDVTGSRMRRQVCHTPERWEARERAAKTLARELDNRPVRGDRNEGE